MTCHMLTRPLLLTSLLVAQIGCDRNAAPASSGGGAASPATASQPWMGGFRAENKVGDLFISSRLVITPQKAEYNVQSTKSGELFAQQVCSVAIDGSNTAPVIPAMSCELSINGNRATRTTAFDFSFDGSAWQLRHNGENTSFARIDGANTTASAPNPNGSRTVAPGPTPHSPPKPTGSVAGRWQRAECARKATGGFTNLPEYLVSMKPDGGQVSTWLAAYYRCIGEPSDAGTASPAISPSVPARSAAAPSMVTPEQSQPGWTGTFMGASSQAGVRLGLVVSDGFIRFVVDGPESPMVCSARIPGGLRASMYRVALDCGGDMTLAGVDSRVSLRWRRDSWEVSGDGAFAGLNGVLSRR
jgi:hypothetical protein